MNGDVGKIRAPPGQDDGNAQRRIAHDLSRVGGLAQSNAFRKKGRAEIEAYDDGENVALAGRIEDACR